MKNFFKVFAISLFAIILINFTGIDVKAAVNGEYANITVVDKTVDDGLADKNKEITVGDIVMKYIGKFIFSLAQLLESAITTFSKWAFGVEEYPWEDYIVFNALPYLDINFFKPASGSIFTVGNVGNIVRSVYFSLLTVALSVLGIGVAVTAIRLAISSIAAEKAKYKEAITKCLYTVVMLFSVHIMISFIFYLNEAIVTGAGKILNSIVNDEDLVNQNLETWAKKSDVIEFLSRNINYDRSYSGNVDGWTMFWDTAGDLASDTKKYLLGGLNDDQQEYAIKLTKRYKKVFTSDQAYAIAWYIIKSGDFLADQDYYINNNGVSKDNKVFSNNIDDAQDTARALIHRTEEVLNAESSDELHYDSQKEAFDMFMGKKKLNLISNLATYFKKNVENLGENDNINFTPLLLYSIMLIQSLMLLINYIKRVFYVTLLVLLAPIVIIYDFFLSAI